MTGSEANRLAEVDQAIVIAYVDGELTEDDAIAFEHRLATEPDLAEAVERAWLMDEAVGRAAAAERGGKQALRGQARARSWPIAHWRVLVTLAAAASLLLFLWAEGSSYYIKNQFTNLQSSLPGDEPLVGPSVTAAWFDLASADLPAIPESSTRIGRGAKAGMETRAWYEETYKPAEEAAIRRFLMSKHPASEVGNRFLAVECATDLAIVVLAPVSDWHWKRLVPLPDADVSTSWFRAGLHVLPESPVGVTPFGGEGLVASHRPGFAMALAEAQQVLLAVSRHALDPDDLSRIDQLIAGPHARLGDDLASLGFRVVEVR